MKQCFLRFFIVIFAFFCLVSLFINARNVLFPLRYKDLIVYNCNKYNLKYEFVSSLIYCESKFKKNAKSKQGAIGLMQIMPLTAQSFYDAGSVFSPELLYDAEVNISIGSKYLNYLFDKYEDIVTVLACYNAGEKVVNLWKGNKKTLSIYDIKYVETKNYVEKVLKYQKVYTSRF